jgi:hypothetical protein
MNTISLDKDLNPTPLVEAVTEKTKAGKIKWEPTAEENTFIATLGGGTTLRIYLTTGEAADEFGNLESVQIPELRLLGEKGKLLWEIRSHQIKGGLWPLFKLAQRIGNKLDERMATLMETLQKL